VQSSQTLKDINIGGFREDFDTGEFDPIFCGLIVALIISREKEG
jgi:hypothetical protein